jgi:hypothetical protein
LILMLVALLGAACGARFESASPGDAMYDEKYVEVVTEAEVIQDSSAPMAGNDSRESAGWVGEEALPRMIIYNGDLVLVVKDTSQAQDDIVELIEGMEGYIVNVSSDAYGGGLMNIHLTVRVPAEAFNAAMSAIRNMAMEVNRDSVSSQDVTQEYVDLESRLRALEVKEARLEELMDQAEDTEAVLAVYQELALTQQDIEQTKGRMRFLERSSAMATIDVQLIPDEISKPVEIAGWRPEGTIKSAIEALVRTFQWIVDVLLWVLIYVAPVLIVVVLVIFIAFKLLGLVLGGRRRRKASENTAEKVDKP